MIPHSKTQNVYKAVQVIDNRFYSITLSPQVSMYALEYILHEITVPKIGFIFAFYNYQYANEFRLRATYWERCAVLYGPAEVHDRYFYRVANTLDAEISRFWEHPVGVNCPPQGTVFCHNFKPIKVVKRFRRNIEETYYA